MKQSFVINIVALILCCLVNVDAIKRILPKYVQVCKRNDPDLSKCWRESVIDLKPYLVKGIPEMDLPPVDPFLIDRLHINQGNRPNLNFQLELTDLKIYGGRDIEVPYAYADLSDKRILNLYVTIHKFYVEGRYRGTGHVLLFDIDSDGVFKVNLTDAKVNTTWDVDLVQSNGEEHLTVVRQSFDITASGKYIYLGDLFRTNAELTENVNRVINENIDALFDDLQSVLTTTLGSITKRHINRVFDLFSYDVLFPES